MSLEGYPAAASVPPGGQIRFHLRNDVPASFTVQFSRISPASGVLFQTGGSVSPQSARANAWEAGAGWPPALTLDVPSDWPSGIYRADFQAGGNQTNVKFVVLPANPGSTSTILLQTAITTEQAYNLWGGHSLYPSPGSPDADTRGRRVSLDRPLPGDSYAREVEYLLWLEEHGLVAEVCTGLDLHAGSVPLVKYSLLLSVGHDEYWSKEMRDAVEGFVDAGGNVAFFSGNVCWWQVRFEDNDRTMVCYKSAVEDPLTGVDDQRVTVNWHDAPVDRPENSMTGVSFRNGAGHWTGGVNGGYSVAFPQHWVFEGTGLAGGATFADGGVGYETDAALVALFAGVPLVTGNDGTPVDFQVLATADLTAWGEFGQPGTATMGIYQGPGTVFTAGTVDWNAALTDPVVSRITQNVVERLSKLKPPDLWAQIGHAADVRAMCGLSWWADLGPGSGRCLFAATHADNRLWRRPPVLVNVTWDPIGEAIDVLAMAGMDARLYALTGDGKLWRRTTLAGVLWEQLGTGPANAGALAAAEGRLYVATTDGSLFSGAPAPAVNWQRIGAANDVAAMTMAGGRLMAVTNDERLLSLSLTQPDGPWVEVGTAPGIVTLGALDGKLFGASAAGGLWVRPPFEPPA